MPPSSKAAANGVLLEDLEDLGVDGLHRVGMTKIEAKKLLRKVYKPNAVQAPH